MATRNKVVDSKPAKAARKSIAPETKLVDPREGADFEAESDEAAAKLVQTMKVAPIAHVQAPDDITGLKPALADPAPKVDPTKKVRKGEEVVVMVPKAFTLTNENHAETHYPVGLQRMPLAHANHWYAKAHGVQIQDDV